ncbi:copper transporter [Myxococcus llanfairpwllgwyngyllgogerychwyrndrobwllllantysiliogogogochensis]|uniref:Copper transporter n=1 Tax=Myxococcus llanfairpwllgwyngyllgogerychwyrndrobwllllantysiliogogogochensis TaxID=2590453 RepID=A0A540WMN3_9BACT|nr:cupredoxin domain-containing protein [Myxococcus llanfairpwllgwyngyllgogerychwyrndrobwllllantysiliogogogochensis]TQF10282.1 copper transporter [Myxococcus llanfairpwllgwyngyllgogerychwyrndrobwllllantysiliogogogochensis]
MRPFISRIIKPWLALAATAAMVGATQQGCTKDTPAAEAAPSAPTVPEKRENGVRVVELTVTEKGYEPSPVTLKKGEPVKLVVTRKTDQTCATEVVMDGYDINTPLPLNQPVDISFTPKESGKLVYGCAMGKMISGVFLVD